MKTLGPTFQAALDDAERYGALLFTFNFAEGAHGIWTGNGTRNYNGLDYVNAGSVFNIGSLAYNNDSSVATFDFSLDPGAGKDIGTDPLEEFYSLTWHMQNVIVEMAMRDKVTDAIIDSEVFFDGLMYQAPMKNALSGGKRIEVSCYSWSIIASQAGNKYRNNSTQQLVDAADTGLVGIGDLVGNIKKNLKFGQAT